MSDIKRTYRDTLFKAIFKESERFLDVYEYCSGKRLKANEITRFDLDSDTVQRERYNDVSFLTNDNRAILMVEHQSTISANLAIKLGAYYFNLLSLWIKRENANIHGETPIAFPHPELYVVYNGKKSYNREFETFSAGDFLNIKVPIVQIHFEKLPDKNADNYLAGYSYLQHEYESKLRAGLDELKAFEYAVEKCKENGYLKGIVEGEDFISMYSDVFSYDSQLRAEGRAEGEAKGRAMLRAVMSSGMSYKQLKSMALTAGIDKAEFAQMYAEFMEEQKAKGIKISISDSMDCNQDLASLSNESRKSTQKSKTNRDEI